MSDNGPKNFKTMIFPPAREGTTTAVYAPLPTPPPPKTISAEEFEQRAILLKQMKKLVNSQRCPVCDAPLEGSVRYDGANVFCAANGRKEYYAGFVPTLTFPRTAVTTLYTTHLGFEIHHLYVSENNFVNQVFQLDLSFSERFQQAEKKELLKYTGDRLILKGTFTEQKLIEKIKLYSIFS